MLGWRRSDQCLHRPALRTQRDIFRSQRPLGSDPLPRTSPQGLDRPDSENNIGYRCVLALRSIALIGPADFSGAGRSKDLRDKLACNALVRGAHSHHSDQVHLECKIVHSRPNTADRPLVPLVTRASASVHLPGYKQKLNKRSGDRRIVGVAGKAMNYQRTGFTPVPTHQDGATVSAFQFDRRIEHPPCWRRRGHRFNKRRWKP